MSLVDLGWRDCCRTDEPPEYWDDDEEREDAITTAVRRAWEAIEELPTWEDRERAIEALRENNEAMIGRKRPWTRSTTLSAERSNSR